MFPFEFRGEVRHGKTRVMGLPCGVSFTILASTVFVQSTRVTDRRPDVQTDRIAITYTRYSIYAVARKNDIAVKGLDGLC